MIADVYAVARLGVAAAMAASPSVAKGWMGEVAEDVDTHVALRSLAGRDAVLSLGVLVARGRGRLGRAALLGCVIADGIDAAGSLADYLRTHRRGAATAAGVAGAGVSLGLVALALSDRGVA